MTTPTTLDWNDLRFALALGKEPTLTAAARALGTSQPTASRRLVALEAALGTKLFLKSARGYVPTAAGQRLLATLGRVEGDLGSLGSVAHDEDRDEGIVRVATTDVTAIHLLESALPALNAEHPKLIVELVVSPRTADLARREADLAVRLVKPEGAELVARSVGAMRYGHFATERYASRFGALDPKRPAGHRFIEPVGDLAGSPEARLYREALAPLGAQASMRTTNMLVMAHAAGRSLGIAILPYPIASLVPSLVLLAPVREIHARTIFLVAHRDAKKLRRVKLVMDAIDRDLRARVTRDAPAAKKRASRAEHAP